jgi:hypothetical protein
MTEHFGMATPAGVIDVGDFVHYDGAWREVTSCDLADDQEWVTLTLDHEIEWTGRRRDRVHRSLLLLSDC